MKQPASFPVLGYSSTIENISWEKIEPYREQAKINHNQTLERLAERGGLNPAEIWCLVHSSKLSKKLVLDQEAAARWLEEWLKK